MLRRTLTLLAMLAVAAPASAARADDWDDDCDWEEDYSGQQPAQQPDDYDVSVDLNVSGSVNFDTFHGSLSPYGEWVSAGGYGRVWRPRVAAGWRPYYYGRWEWTNEGWLWASDEPWGWAAYHYGRWTYDSYYGWVWVPGYQWAPAWVAWRYSGDVVGWAPLGPGVSVYVSSYPFVDYWWTFVPCGSVRVRAGLLGGVRPGLHPPVLQRHRARAAHRTRRSRRAGPARTRAPGVGRSCPAGDRAADRARGDSGAGRPCPFSRRGAYPARRGLDLQTRRAALGRPGRHAAPARDGGAWNRSAGDRTG